MTARAKVSAPRTRRPHARAWAREVVGELPAISSGGHALDARLTAYASHVVANACLKVRVQEGAPACQALIENLILSAVHVASGEAPSKVLRDLADALDEPLDPSVRERANA